LLKQSTEEDLIREEVSLIQVWNEAFVEYYNIHLPPDIIGYSAKWVIEQSGATYNPLSDITNNAAESMNRVLHRLQGIAITMKDKYKT
jgi:hypothetical protein